MNACLDPVTREQSSIKVKWTRTACYLGDDE
jgi:hypothetical protein